MKIALAADHGGWNLKAAIQNYLQKTSHQVVDLGIDQEERVDYPDFAAKVARQVSQGRVDLGILVCGTGIGMAITANKFKGVRAAVVTDLYTARMSKEHNNANVIALGGRVLKEDQALEIVKTWLEAKFEGGRHQERLNKIAKIERENFL
ncbi:MAG: ribose 5-phosphate isomerase B [Deltaproteobacteria bacterium]|nr:ribose 5-phosphate isomerase B [Deltaproteobacteria bacterium]